MRGGTNRESPSAGFRVDFLIVGTQKAGTSALAHYLGRHPDVGMARKKEVHFFDRGAWFLVPKLGHRVYRFYFDLRLDKAIYGEATPVYMYWHSAMRRIWRYNPAIKLIAVLRNPVERAFSHWNMERGRGLESEDFDYCIRHEAERSRSVLAAQHRVRSYVDRGFYAPQIRRMQRYFPADQLLFLKYEAFVAEQETAVADVFRFLGVDPSRTSFEEKRVHVRPYDQRIDESSRRWLAHVYERDIREVERLLGWSCSDWLS